ncbi:hypothetical protein Micbo1qcDRAFT_30428 [Microdochium bolleyi]|uniref:PSI domain-containing protein n=1 Tax=Microdochium bolleyi TaxID=196109 RepID=A0A136JFQ7_9PEZI|nr:hypothetical protein Micbo1qcDRAFT_30428 [Microdochium bolleyi]
MPIPKTSWNKETTPPISGPPHLGNTTNSHNDDDDDHLHRCWHLTNCKDCLGMESDCSWCPFSWTCVPNRNKNLPFLAPAWDEDICPHWAERWELRTRPLGCQVSTITTLTSLVTIACTLTLVLLGFGTIFGVRQVSRWCGRRRIRKGRSVQGGDEDHVGAIHATGAARLEGDARSSRPSSAGDGVDGLISRLRAHKSQDDAARVAVEANGCSAHEREPLLGVTREAP